MFWSLILKIEFSTVPINDLRINFTSDLKWSAHIDVRIRKAFSRFMMLKRSLPTILPANVKSRLQTLYPTDNHLWISPMVSQQD